MIVSLSRIEGRKSRVGIASFEVRVRHRWLGVFAEAVNGTEWRNETIPGRAFMELALLKGAVPAGAESGT